MAVLVHGDISHTLAAVVVAAIEGTDQARVGDVAVRNIHPVGAVLHTRFSPSRAFPSHTIPPAVNPSPPTPTANPSSSSYESHGSGLVGPAAALDGVKILMTTMLKVVVVMARAVVVLSVAETILDDVVVKAMADVDLRVHDDAALMVVVRVDASAIATVFGGVVKELKAEEVEMNAMDTGVVGWVMQVADVRSVALAGRHSCRHH